MHAISSNNLTVYLYMVFMSWSDATNLVTRFVSLSEMAMEECCGHEELELYVNLGSEDINVKQCGIQMFLDQFGFHTNFILSILINMKFYEKMQITNPFQLFIINMD